MFMTMKKIYMTPTIEALSLLSEEIIALSIVTDSKADDSDALVKDSGWDEIWDSPVDGE